MKKTFLALLIAVAAISGVVFVQDSGWAAEPAPSGSRVIAYYFYGSVRCPTCHKLEQYSKDVIQGNFKDELTSGKLAFQAKNTDEKGNEHFIKDYQLYTKSLVLSFVKDGREVKSKNLVNIWQLVRNKQEFFEYVTSEINDFLKEV